VRLRWAAVALVPTALGALPAGAAERCSHVVVVTMPGTTWEDVSGYDVPELRGAAEDGAVGSISVDRGGTRAAYASAYATIGAGTRAEADAVSFVRLGGGNEASSLRPMRIDNLAAIRDLTAEGGYRARPGAMASALGDPAIAIEGRTLDETPFVLLAAMDAHGLVDLAGPDLPDVPGLVLNGSPSTVPAALDEALRAPCSTVLVDAGGLLVADRAAGGDPGSFATELEVADRLLGYARRRLDPASDLLLVVTPTSPAPVRDVHLGIAVAVGPAFAPGSTLQSPSTRLPGMVALSDVAPTVLAHHGADLPASMLGRAFYAVDGPSNRVEAAIDLDRESTFAHSVQNEILTWYVAIQILIYAGAAYVLVRYRKAGPLVAAQIAALAVLWFPASAYLAGVAEAHELGTVRLVVLLLAVDAGLTAATCLLARPPLDRLLLVALGTFGLLAGDTLLGGPLQLNTVFGNLPILGARFAGLGNNAFAALGASTVIGGALVVERWGARAVPLAAAGAIFALAVIVDGAPQLGSDVGGVIALVPGLALTFFLLAGRRVGWRFALVTGLGLAVVLTIFLVLDLTGPPEVRSHLGKLAEAVRSRGLGVLFITIGRKLETNIGVFEVTVWTFFVPPVVAGLAWLLLRWRSLAKHHPRLRAGMIGAVFIAIVGFAVNDSGIIIPAMFLPFLIPSAILAAISMHTEPDHPPPAPAPA
jgi:hypothetical protein